MDITPAFAGAGSTSRWREAFGIGLEPMAANASLCLAAVLDWFTRRVLSWRVSITLEADFCIEAVEDALARHGQPEIFDMEHGRAIGSSGHATSGQPVHFHRLHQGAGMPGNQDQHGRQRGLAGQRLRRTPGRAIKYEAVYLRAYASVSEARASIGRCIVFYNTVRRRTRTNGVCLLTPHSSLDGKTPDQAYFNLLLPVPVAA